MSGTRHFRTFQNQHKLSPINRSLIRSPPTNYRTACPAFSGGSKNRKEPEILLLNHISAHRRSHLNNSLKISDLLFPYRPVISKKPFLPHSITFITFLPHSTLPHCRFMAFLSHSIFPPFQQLTYFCILNFYYHARNRIVW